jgi:hypothetical protein
MSKKDSRKYNALNYAQMIAAAETGDRRGLDKLVGDDRGLRAYSIAVGHLAKDTGDAALLDKLLNASVDAESLKEVAAANYAYVATYDNPHPSNEVLAALLKRFADDQQKKDATLRDIFDWALNVGRVSEPAIHLLAQSGANVRGVVEERTGQLTAQRESVSKKMRALQRLGAKVMGG